MAAAAGWSDTLTQNSGESLILLFYTVKLDHDDGAFGAMLSFDTGKLAGFQITNGGLMKDPIGIAHNLKALHELSAVLDSIYGTDYSLNGVNPSHSSDSTYTMLWANPSERTIYTVIADSTGSITLIGAPAPQIKS